jgi:ABC-type oligopeptide transport system substrate-binding subunit
MVDCVPGHCAYGGGMTRLLSFLLLLLSATLAGCSDGVDNERVRVDVIEERPRPFNVSATPLPLASSYLRAATAQGLVTFDQKGRVAPGLANRWIVTEDGMSYIFRLNKTRWNDGREISSQEVARLLTVRIRELGKGRLGPELGVIDRVVAMTGKVVEIRLKAPMPYLLELLALPEFGLLSKGAGSGPMQAKKFGQAMQLRRNETDAEGAQILGAATVTLRRGEASLVLARYALGQSDLVEGGRFENFPLLEAAKIRPNEIQFDAVPGLFGLQVVQAGPFLSDAANRAAVAMAIDRPKLLTAFDIVAWRETVTLVPESLPNRAEIARPDWATPSIDERRTIAAATVANWKAENGDMRPLRVALPRGYGSRIFFARLRADLATIKVDIERVTIDRPHDLLLVDRTAEQSSPAWYLDQLSCKFATICNARADEIVAQARLTNDMAMRAQLLGEAETELQSTVAFIPLANPLRWSIVRPGLLGHFANGRGWHLLQYLGRDPT